MDTLALPAVQHGPPKGTPQGARDGKASASQGSCRGRAPHCDSGECWELERGSGPWGQRTGSSPVPFTSDAVTSSTSLVCENSTTNADSQAQYKPSGSVPGMSGDPRGLVATTQLLEPQRAPPTGVTVFKIQRSVPINLLTSPNPQPLSPPTVSSPLWAEARLAVPRSWTLPHFTSSALSLSLSFTRGCEQEWLNQDRIVFN